MAVSSLKSKHPFLDYHGEEREGKSAVATDPAAFSGHLISYLKGFYEAHSLQNTTGVSLIISARILLHMLSCNQRNKRLQVSSSLRSKYVSSFLRRHFSLDGCI